MFYDYLCKGKSLYLSTQCLLITISFPDMDIVDKLNKEFLTQPFCKNEQHAYFEGEEGVDTIWNKLSGR